MKNYISFILIIFGIIMLASDCTNLTYFYLSKLIGFVVLAIGCVLIPRNYLD